MNHLPLLALSECPAPTESFSGLGGKKKKNDNWLERQSGQWRPPKDNSWDSLMFYRFQQMHHILVDRRINLRRENKLSEEAELASNDVERELLGLQRSKIKQPRFSGKNRWEIDREIWKRLSPKSRAFLESVSSDVPGFHDASGGRV